MVLSNIMSSGWLIIRLARERGQAESASRAIFEQLTTGSQVSESSYLCSDSPAAVTRSPRATGDFSRNQARVAADSRIPDPLRTFEGEQLCQS
jgi:hypothetical protein